MLINSKNELLYDAKNFDNYHNIYCILKKTNKQYDNKLLYEYYDGELKLLLEEFPAFIKEHKIIFGHYYNNENTFIYKNVQNGKIVSYEIKHCNNNELYYKNNKLIYGDTYDSIKMQIDNINLDEINKYKEKYSNPLSISYNKENNNLNINLNKICITSFNNGCVSINNKIK